MTNYKVTSKLHSTKPGRSEHSFASRALRMAISWYQQARVGRLSPCRFYPSCSEYAAEAIEQHGSLKGSALALRRLSKCRPLGPHGVDLVPESKKVRTSAP